MKTLYACVTSFLLGAALFVASGVAHANKIDTLTGQIPGHQIGCNYTFQNGDPSIPCAADIVAADGTVSFIKPNAPFDNIEYFDSTAGKPLAAFFNPINVPIDGILEPGTQYPILRSGNDFPASSFFDVFVDINLPTFDSANLQLPGAFHVGELLHFDSGANTDGFPSILISGFTGTAIVVGFDLVSVPEPSTWLLLGSGLVGLAAWRRKKAA